MRTETLRIAGDLGGELSVVVFRFGATSSRPKIYIQAATHADELVGSLALDALIDRLADAEQNGYVVGEIVLVPFANPIGLAQSIAGTVVGRFDLQGGSNFNSGWPSLRASQPRSRPASRARPRSSQRVRAHVATMLNTAKAATALGRLRLRLLQEAYDTDIALDLHCAPNSAAFAFMNSRHWPTQIALAAALDLRWVLVGEDASSTSFEDTLNNVWLTDDTFRGEVGGCFSCTIELPNPGSHQEQHAIQNAAGLYRYLQHVGAISETAAPLPDWRGSAAPYNDIVSVASDRGGLVILRVDIGESVHEGQVVAQVLEPALLLSRNRRRSLLAPCAGTVLTMAESGTLLAGGHTACAIVPTFPVTRPDRTFIDVDTFG